MKNGQFSIEFLFAIGFIVFIFLILLFFGFSKGIDVGNIKKSFDEKKDCLKVAKAIDEIYFNCGSIKFKVYNNFTIDNNIVYVGNEFCNFFALNISNKNLNNGLINVGCVNETVEVRNE